VPNRNASFSSVFARAFSASARFIAMLASRWSFFATFFMSTIAAFAFVAVAVAVAGAVAVAAAPGAGAVLFARDNRNVPGAEAFALVGDDRDDDRALAGDVVVAVVVVAGASDGGGDGGIGVISSARDVVGVAPRRTSAARRAAAEQLDDDELTTSFFPRALSPSSRGRAVVVAAVVGAGAGAGAGARRHRDADARRRVARARAVATGAWTLARIAVRARQWPRRIHYDVCGTSSRQQQLDRSRTLLVQTTRSILSVRECARLQTFPDHFEFVSGHGASDAGVKQSLRGLGNARATRVGEEYRMVGNAVPPLLATRVGDAFLRANFSPVSDDESA